MNETSKKKSPIRLGPYVVQAIAVTTVAAFIAAYVTSGFRISNIGDFLRLILFCLPLIAASFGFSAFLSDSEGGKRDVMVGAVAGAVLGIVYGFLFVLSFGAMAGAFGFPVGPVAIVCGVVPTAHGISLRHPTKHRLVRSIAASLLSVLILLVVSPLVFTSASRRLHLDLCPIWVEVSEGDGLTIPDLLRKYHDRGAIQADLPELDGLDFDDLRFVNERCVGGWTVGPGDISTTFLFTELPVVDRILPLPKNFGVYLYRGGVWTLYPKGVELSGIEVELKTTAGTLDLDLRYGPQTMPFVHSRLLPEAAK